MRNPMTILLAAVALLGALAMSAAAREWEWSYNPGTRWPEDYGWKLNSQDPPAKRWIEGGQIHFDSRPPYGSWAAYDVEFPHGGIHPEHDETFIMRARVKVDYVSKFFGDASMGVWADNRYGDGFLFGVSRVWAGAGNRSAEIEPYVFHDYELRSRDMRAYDFFIDGKLAWKGNFVYGGGGTPYVGWGDGSTNYGVSHWDYVSFAMVSDARKSFARDSVRDRVLAPEPSTILVVGWLLSIWPRARSGT